MRGNDGNILLSTAYYPPVSYFASIVNSKSATIEQYGTYRKQSYRNRCHIYGPNGLQPLSVPVSRGSFHHVDINEIEIDYSRPWVKNHLRSIKTAYNTTPFYEFLADEILEPLQSKHLRLLDLNNHILRVVMELIEADTAIDETVGWKHEVEGIIDMRESMDPKKAAAIPRLKFPYYFQPFSPSGGFLPDLSILDLVFNMGPESYSYLRSCLG